MFIVLIIILTIIVLFYIFVPRSTLDIGKFIISIAFMVAMIFIFIVSSLYPEGGAAYKATINRVMITIVILCAIGFWLVITNNENVHNFDDALTFIVIGVSAFSLVPFALNPDSLCSVIKMT